MEGLKNKGPLEPTPGSHRRRLGRTHFVSLLAALGALAWINGYFRGTEPTASYALCSPHGTENTYTVDANDTKAQCLVVKGERFVHTSAYGEYVKTPKILRETDPNSPLAELHDQHPGIRVKFIQPNAIIIPGITG